MKYLFICIQVFLVSLPSVAEELNPEKTFNQGTAYWFGMGVEVNREKACLYFKEASDLNYAEAVYNYGNCVRKGIGEENNYEKALSLYLHAESLGSNSAKVAYSALILVEKEDKKHYSQAVKKLEEYLDMKPNDPVANFLLANAYFLGKGTSINEDNAFKYYEKAASNGNLLAIALMSHVYRSGSNGYIKDMEKSNYWSGLFKEISELTGSNKSIHDAIETLTVEGWGIRK